jgi:hypothetical protein
MTVLSVGQSSPGKLNYIGTSDAEMQAEPEKPGRNFRQRVVGTGPNAQPHRRVRSNRERVGAEACQIRLLKPNTRAPFGGFPAGRLPEAVAAHQEEAIAVGLQNHLVAVGAGSAEELLQPHYGCPPAGRAALVFDGDGTTESLKGQSSHGRHDGKTRTTLDRPETADLAARRARSLAPG